MNSETQLRPNAFHFHRQIIILQRAGGGSAERQFSVTWLPGKNSFAFSVFLRVQTTVV